MGSGMGIATVHDITLPPSAGFGVAPKAALRDETDQEWLPVLTGLCCLTWNGEYLPAGERNANRYVAVYV